ncbi:MAG: sigma-70 family RNA polymerase sigma factor [Candidatus Poribacteria bacterium]|nr:sigma-70 family RNA polymerase sigma factor [Candidatus Poribacteria bacterium]
MNAEPTTQSLPELIEEVRPSVYALCYRLVGSVEDAEDLTQETFIRVMDAFDRFEWRSSFRTWALRIATNVCYTFLQSVRKRREVVLPDPFVTAEPFDDAVAAERDADGDRQSMEYSFVCVLQELTPLQRLVVVLRDVLGWSVQETAEALDSEPAAVKNAHSRARKHLKARKKKGRTVPPAHPSAQELMLRFADTQVKADVEACMSLYRNDAEVYLFPSQKIAGKAAIREFHQRLAELPPRLFVGVRLNGNLGAACYHPTPDGKLARTGVVMLEAVNEFWRSGAHIGRAFWAMQPEHMTTIPTPTEMDQPSEVTSAFVL